MADNATIEITGLDERIKKFGEASTKNPMMRKRINEVIRTALREVRKKLQNDAKNGLDMQSDPRKHIRPCVWLSIAESSEARLISYNRARLVPVTSMHHHVKERATPEEGEVTEDLAHSVP